jgi:hypothetical protein
MKLTGALAPDVFYDYRHVAEWNGLTIWKDLSGNGHDYTQPTADARFVQAVVIYGRVLTDDEERIVTEKLANAYP